MLKIYLFLFVISILIYFLHASYTKQGLYGDGNGYYVYTNTIYFQHNLDFAPIYNYLSNFTGKKYIFSRIFWNQNYNPFTIGTSLLWLPSLAFIYIIQNIFNLDLNRFDLIYELGPGITGIVFMLGGLFLLQKFLENYYSQKSAILSILVIYFASNVFYYSAFEPALSHQPSFFIICLLLFWTYKFNKTTLNLFIFGLICGLLFTVRMVDSILLLPLIFKIKPRLQDVYAAGLGGLLAISPQLIYQFIKYGSFFTNPYFTGANGSWSINIIHFFEYLFSPKRGLILWTPLFAPAIYGLAKARKYIFIFTIILLWIITSSWSAYLSAGFGQRFSFSAIPYFAFGLAYVIEKSKNKFINLILLCCLIWNLLLIKNIYLHKNLFIQDDNFTYNQFFSFMAKIK